MKPIARCVRVLVVTLAALICFAFLDRIPDPPSVVQKRSLDTAKQHHSDPLQKVARISFYFGILRPPARLSLAVSLDRAAPEFDSLTRWRTAADSSPPSVPS